MFLLRGLLDRLLLVGAIVAGGLIPGFIVQYQQRLGGRLDQARIDLEPWQRIAEQFHQGELDRLIQYHLASSDPTFHAEGAAIAALRDSVLQLQAMVDALQGNVFQQAGYLAMRGDASLARATLSDWVPTFALSGDGLLFALLFAAVIWLTFVLVWHLVAAGSNRLIRRLTTPLPRTRAGGIRD